jgi:hypothetical protein
LQLVLLGGVILTNAFWNYLFFGARNLLHAFLIAIPYSALAVTRSTEQLLRIQVVLSLHRF